MNKKVRAIIFQDNKLLLMHRIKNNEEYWVFPGGSIEDSDSSLEDGLKRECLEELGIEIKVGELFAEDFFKDPNEQQLFYLCKIAGGTLGTGIGPESTRDPSEYGTYEIQWIPIDKLANKTIHPQKILDMIVNL